MLRCDGVTERGDHPSTGTITPNDPPNAPRARFEPLRAILADPVEFSRRTMGDFRLRRYQEAPARGLAAAIASRDRDLGIVFSRQSGKDELLAQLLAFFLVRYQRAGGSVVVAAPTLRPQAINTRDRLIARLDANPLGAGTWRDGFTVGMGRAAVQFASAGKDANVRGLTASRLLVANEAQDVDPDRWDAVFSPMTASTAAASLIMGTEFDGTGLLARQVDHLKALEAGDGRRRLYFVDWRPIAAEVPAYAEHYRRRVEQFGEDHPFIRTEYWLERLEEGMGLFPPARLARMKGFHRRQSRGEAGKQYALAVDVAGEAEQPRLGGDWDPGAARDSTALTVFEVSPGKGAGAEALPVYRVVDRRLWTGANHVKLGRELVRLAREVWGVSAVAIDATGVGAGLASQLADRLGQGRRPIAVYPFVFTLKSKSDLGWGFTGLIDAGRYHDYLDDGAADTAQFWRETGRCVMSVIEGPNRRLAWGARPGEHDDALVSASLCWWLDQHDWRSKIARGGSWTE